MWKSKRFKVSGGVIFMSVGQTLAELLNAIPNNTTICPARQLRFLRVRKQCKGRKHKQHFSKQKCVLFYGYVHLIIDVPINKTIIVTNMTQTIGSYWCKILWYYFTLSADRLLWPWPLFLPVPYPSACQPIHRYHCPSKRRGCALLEVKQVHTFILFIFSWWG